jgi:hypothetical protein
MFKLICAIAALPLLAACASPTPYAPLADRYGYAEQQIEDNRYRVTFTGNNVTVKETVENYLLYRAAELTRTRGYDYFELTDRDTDKSTRYLSNYTTFGHFRSRHNRFGLSHSAGPGFVTGTTRPITEYEATATILLFRGDKPADKAQAYDARDVLQRLGPRIRRPAPPAPS